MNFSDMLNDNMLNNILNSAYQKLDTNIRRVLEEHSWTVNDVIVLRKYNGSREEYYITDKLNEPSVELGDTSKYIYVGSIP